MIRMMILAAAVLLAQSFGVTAASATDASYMTLISSPYPIKPVMWKEFCLQSPAECAVGEVAEVAFTPTLIAELEQVNAEVNGRGNRTRNNCVWITLEKRRMLVQKGLPQSALLPTLVRAVAGDHMVLTVKTSAGEYVMDNFIYPHKVVLWSRQVKYRFASRYQGTRAGWVNIADYRTLAVALK